LARTGLGTYDRLGALPASHWGDFLRIQARRILLMLLPFDMPFSKTGLWMIRGMLLLGAVAVWRQLIEWRVVATLGLSGLMWAVFMRRFVAFHDFQSIYFIGLPLLLYSAIIIQIKFIRKTLVASALAICITFVFITCVVHDGISKTRKRTANEPYIKEFQSIYEMLPPAATVFIAGDRTITGMAYHELDFYLIETIRVPEARADYVVSLDLHYNANRLTKNNFVNLFRNRVLR
jgi:hypothetical protein